MVERVSALPASATQVEQFAAIVGGESSGKLLGMAINRKRPFCSKCGKELGSRPMPCGCKAPIIVPAPPSSSTASTQKP